MTMERMSVQAALFFGVNLPDRGPVGAAREVRPAAGRDGPILVDRHRRRICRPTAYRVADQEQGSVGTMLSTGAVRVCFELAAASPSPSSGLMLPGLASC